MFRTWLENQSQIYYWVASKGFNPNVNVGPLKTGFQVPPPNKNSGVFSPAEQHLDNFRSIYFPNKPSRVKSSYVCETLEDAKRWLWYLMPAEHKTLPKKSLIYEVNISGNTHKGDGSIVYKLYYKDWSLKDEETDTLCQRYWAGLGINSQEIDLPEILVEGPVTIIKQVIDDMHFLKIGDTVRLSAYNKTGVIDNITPNGDIHLKNMNGLYSPKDAVKVKANFLNSVSSPTQR